MFPKHSKSSRQLAKKGSIRTLILAVGIGMAGLSIQNANALSSPTNGAPFGNGSFYSTDGTFQATIRGKNLSGVATFSTSSSGAGTGTFSVFYNGETYVGNVNSAINPAANQISATFEASIDRNGLDTLITTIASDSFILTDVTQTASGTPPVVLTNVTETLVRQDLNATSNVNDVLYASGSFLANTFNTHPAQQFAGKGKMTFQELQITFSETNSSALAIPQLLTTTVDIKVDGVRTSDTAGTYTAFDVSVPTVVTTYQIVDAETTGG